MGYLVLPLFREGIRYFRLLFGFSFFIQFDNQARKGKDFRLRFFWRLMLLFFIGCFNASFFPGEILVLYSILGIVLIPVCKLSNKMVLAIGRVFDATAHGMG